MRDILSLLIVFAAFNTAFSQSELTQFSNHSIWADSVLQTLSLDEKIGQLIMVTTYPSQGEENERKIQSWVKDQKVGGVLFLRTSPNILRNCANFYQGTAEIPLFIGLDAENGLSFRLDSVVRYPYAMGLGSLSNDSLLYKMGREIGQQCKMLGVNLNFAPVADVNSNPDNPIINYRSFGENPYRVAQKSWQLAKGMQDERILVSAKHFPGHGDTSYDSHLTMPAISKNYEQLDSIDFIPFKTCIDSGINGIMSAHINMNGIENTERPATLSKYVMHAILRDSLGFDGLIFSDGMNMRGITMQFSEGDAAVEAIKAGVDVIEFVLHPELVINAIKLAVKNGEITEAEIHQKCRKVLLAKEWMGLQNYETNKLTDLNASLNSNTYKLTSRRLYEQAITVIKNHNSILPLQRLDTLKIASLSIGKENITHFQNRLNKYMDIDNYHIGLNASEVEIDRLITMLKSYNLVIAGVHGTSLSNSKNYKIKEVHKKVVREVCLNTNSILAFFSNPYALTQFKSLELSEALLVSYGESYLAQDYAAQIIFGAIGCDSKLPVSISKYFKEGIGYELKRNGRLKYTIPEEEGFDSELLKIKIDSFANYGIKEKIFPGCQVLVAKNGKVIYHESYGFHTYDSIAILRKDDLYDWASLTKITGPLPILMKFTEDSVLNLDKPFCSYWPDFRNTNKESITLREILAHQAGFKPWIPFYVNTLKKNNDFKKRFLRTRPSSNFPYRVASNLYINKNYKKKMFNAITELEMNEKKYRYSGLAFYLFPDMISNITGSEYEQCLYDSFYKPLGASSVCYNPYTKFTKNIIVPTEQDDLFRKELLQGFVHDEGAAMLGGVSGNAGLFGRTNDLAKIMQFYLKGGTYGDFKYLKPETIKEFTRIQYEENDNRRGLGFDKPYIDNANKKLKDAYPAIAVSKESFGHSGFTGTFAWADPKNQLIFIFMSNRVYPSRENTKLFSLNFRPELQQSIYGCENTFSESSY